MELKKGTTLQGGKYRIEKKLGQGSFGITYLATAKFSTDSGLGKMDVIAKVCIKEFFMSDVNSRQEDGSTIEGSKGTVFTNYRRKFRKEAENLAKLSHKNIVKVFDVFDENGTSYYVMEFLDGENLNDYIKSKGHLPEDEALKIIKKVGSALSYMHSQQMLHLDLKPKNVMMTSDGQIHLIDFGLSKQYTQNGEPESSTTIGLGTAGYAPLEQSQYKQDGTFPATLDVYALGATLFKMLTGQRPPEATNILNEGFPYIDLKDVNISIGTIDCLAKAMNPAKKNRWQSVDSLISGFDNPKDEVTITDKKTNEKVPFYAKKSFGIIIAIVGFILIMVMEPFVHKGRFNFSDLDSDGLKLALLYGVGTIGLAIFFIRRYYFGAKINVTLKYIFLGLFVINTLLLQMWNYSLTTAYMILSIGLLLNIIILYFCTKPHEQN